MGRWVPNARCMGEMGRNEEKFGTLHNGQHTHVAGTILKWGQAPLCVSHGMHVAGRACKLVHAHKAD